MNELLQFEKEKCRDPRRFPMHFRLKLDLCGIKLSKRDWLRFDPAEKEQLLAMRCETPEQITAFAKKLRALIRACDGDSFEIQPTLSLAGRTQPWSDKAAIPDAVRRQIEGFTCATASLEAWAGLSDLQRFALIKLTAPGKVKPGLHQVLEDFSILPPEGRPV